MKHRYKRDGEYPRNTKHQLFPPGTENICICYVQWPVLARHFTPPPRMRLAPQLLAAAAKTTSSSSFTPPKHHHHDPANPPKNPPQRWHPATISSRKPSKLFKIPDHAYQTQLTPQKCQSNPQNHPRRPRHRALGRPNTPHLP